MFCAASDFKGDLSLIIRFSLEGASARFKFRMQRTLLFMIVCAFHAKDTSIPPRISLDKSTRGLDSMLALLRLLSFCVCLCTVVSSASPIAFTTRGKSGSSVNYADVRARVTHGFIEKANEMANAIAVLQDLSKATVDLSEQIAMHCGK